MPNDPRAWQTAAIVLLAHFVSGCPSPGPSPLASSEAENEEVDGEVPSLVYFGDLHVHTSLSADAYILGTRATLDDAYGYAKGEAIASVAGAPIQARQALDFLAVTDHAEYLGLQDRLLEPLRESPMAATTAFVDGLTKTFALMTSTIQSATPYPDWIDTEKSVDGWRQAIDAANRHHEPGRFTTLLGFEWTATPDGRNLHRNVIIDPEGIVPDSPVSVFDEPEPEGLWRWMEEERRRGVRLLAIPHNSNLSDGAMFARTDSLGRPIDPRYAKLRKRNEPLVEVTQIKGTSETHPMLSPADEYADFEIWSSRVAVDGVDPTVAVSGSYAREALVTGLALKAEIGTNPYQFGLIGSTDSHRASSPVEEDNYTGKGVQDTSASMRLLTTPIPDSVQKWSASGLAAVWARENSRAEIFDALARKEVYATTGTRIRLRFFAGWAYGSDLLDSADWVERAYAGGIPMGGTLGPRPTDIQAPSLAVLAFKDPKGAPLDRIQVIKGSLIGGERVESVFDVAVSKPGGSASLTSLWTDPDFDASVEAFYYVRVLEIPTPRWSTYDARRLEIDPLESVPLEIQERAFSSPIWYSPEKSATKRPMPQLGRAQPRGVEARS